MEHYELYEYDFKTKPTPAPITEKDVKMFYAHGVITIQDVEAFKKGKIVLVDQFYMILKKK